ncbi:DUF6801 domain-containing protein [Nocardioides sp. LHG3406-4]|uniref:Ig-like domain-containing protein n=1 Tax=Nocardioides sp. LHG3406-4 TaxID=2804575 RepID=UPI003CF28EE8
MLHTTSRRLAATVAATALSAGALVAATAPVATAAEASTTYTCKFPSLGDKVIPVKVSAPALPTAAAAGLDLPAGAVVLDVTLPADVVGAAKMLGATELGGFSRDMVASIVETGSTTSSADLALNAVDFPRKALPAVPAPMTLSTPAATSTAPAPAMTAPADLPDAGAYSVNLPKAFSFTATRQGGGTLLADIPCLLTPGAVSSLGTITLAKNESETSAKAVKKVTKVGKPAKVKITVEAANEVPSGTVKVLKGTKVLGKATLNKAGTVVVKLKKALPAGVTKVKASYLGDGYTEASKSKKIKIRVG